MFLFAFWLKNRPFIKYFHNWRKEGRDGRGSSKMCTGAYRGEGGDRETGV